MDKEFEQAGAMPKAANSRPARLAVPPDLLLPQVLSQTRMAISIADPREPDTPLVFVNDAFCGLTGYAPDEVLGRNCRFLQGPDTDRRQVAKIAQALADEDVIVAEVLNYRKDGTAFWNALHVGPVYDEAGELLYYYGSQWDVSNVRMARAEERQARELSRELSHRMKNMFSVMNAIVSMTGRSESDALVATEKISGRIMALGRAHEATLASATGTEAVDLGPMLATVLGPYDRSDRIAFSGPPARLDNNAVSMLGLALHELAINAMKYGSLSVPEGHVALSWSSEPGEQEDTLVLSWLERGGPPAPKPTHVGLGSGIVANLLRSADGDISYAWAEAGLTATIRMPLPRTPE